MRSSHGELGLPVMKLGTFLARHYMTSFVVQSQGLAPLGRLRC